MAAPSQTRTEPTNPLLDLAIGGASEDPAPLVARLRQQDPVCWIPGLDVWLVTRHEDVRALFADDRVTADPRVFERHLEPSDERARRWLGEMPFRSRPSEPGNLGRRLVSAALTPRAVSRMELRIQEVVEEHAAPLRERRDVVDLVGEFTAPVAANVIGRILGVPPMGEDLATFRRLAISATRSINPVLSEKKRRKNERAGVAIAEYVLELVRERRRQRRDDMISDLVSVSDGASDDDITRVVAGLVSAGTGTTSIATARGLRTLLHHPATLAELRANRSLLPDAVQELLRYDSGLIVMPRYVVDDFEFRGRTLRRGQLVGLSMMGANRDPAVFDDPDVLDIRRDNKSSLSFGYGSHYCIGSNIARTEMRLMIDAALDFMPEGARLLEERIRWSARGLMSQIKALPVDFGG
ncbi:MAG: cytochrome P450 [Myxococcota bacterium]|nr:cytochrome P450 [Myxococcota bacterium]